MAHTSSTEIVLDENNQKLTNISGQVLVQDTCKCNYRISTKSVINNHFAAGNLFYAILENENCEEEKFTESATKLLLELLMNYKIQLRGPKIKKKLLWTTLSTEMKEHGFTMSSNVIERKFRNMKHQFLKIRDNNTKTGRGRQSWQYFNIMQDLFHDDTCGLVLIP